MVIQIVLDPINIWIIIDLIVISIIHKILFTSHI